MAEKKVFIVGAGLSGLCAAITARKMGYEVHCVDKYNRAGGKPLFHLETAYEHEHNSTSASLRQQAYGTALWGANLGHIFGNCPLWGLGPGTNYPSPFCSQVPDWRNELNSTGSVEFGAHRDAAGVGQRPGLRLSDPSGRDRAAEHVGAEAAAFLLGPDRQFDRTQRAHLVIVERPDDLQAAEHAQAAIEASRRRDGVNM